MASIADLEQEMHARQVAQYRRLQERALAVAYEQKTGHPPADRAEILKRFPGQVVPTVDPTRYLSPQEISAALASLATGAVTMATGCTATG